jgi:hypothetical protein
MENLIRKCAASVLIGLGLLGLGGCATGGNYSVQDDIGYEKFLALRGDYRLVERNNDVYLEKIDGSDSRQITHTPDIREFGADFACDGKYILYSEDAPDYSAKIRGKYYRINYNSDDSSRKQISLDEYGALIEQNRNNKTGTGEEE